jgi:hypothetical protein
MGGYSLFKFLHVSAAVIRIGAGLGVGGSLYFIPPALRKTSLASARATH